MKNLDMLNGLIEALAEAPSLHCATTSYYRFMNALCKKVFRASSLSEPQPTPVEFAPFGSLAFPYQKMGAIDSIDLFGLDELIIFAFYWANRNRYRRTVDIGANLGLHSILMARNGFSVTAFEPDPVHFDLLKRNLQLNGATGVTPIQAAVSDRDGKLEFVRVKGNTTGSHLAGAKSNPYGELDRFDVDVRACMMALDGADFAKIDAEGHEVTILSAIPASRWERLDAIVEVGTTENARALFTHFIGLPISLFAQKTGWSRVILESDIPTSHREGSLFITSKTEMPWA
jgi:FkbM family methyltransferase